jgi:hypothetical protein
LLGQWEFQDPKVEVLSQYKALFWEHSPYIGLICGKYLQSRYLNWPLTRFFVAKVVGHFEAALPVLSWKDGPTSTGQKPPMKGEDNQYLYVDVYIYMITIGYMTVKAFWFAFYFQTNGSALFGRLRRRQKRPGVEDPDAMHCDLGPGADCEWRRRRHCVCLAAFATGLSVMNNINAQRR